MKFQKCNHYDGKCPCLKCENTGVCMACNDTEVHKAGFAVETENLCEAARKYCESGRKLSDEIKPHQPLTLEELKERVGKPVWLESKTEFLKKEWVLLRKVTEDKVLYTDKEGTMAFLFTVSDFGKMVDFFEHEPKESEK